MSFKLGKFQILRP